MERTDRELVSALRLGAPGAFDDVYRRHHARIWTFLARLCGNRPEAEELFQETWLAVARYASRLDAEVELVPLLYTIARNKHRSARRFAIFDTRRRARFADEPMAGPVQPDEHAAIRARTSALAEAFDALPAAHREVLLLCTVEGLDAAQAAGVLGLREDAVRKRLSRARADLARRLERREADPGPRRIQGEAP